MIFENISFFLWLDEIAVVCFGFMGGVYFAFSFFVMQSFNKISPLDAIRSMNSINTVILKSPFILLFFFSTFIAFLLFLENLIFYKVLSYKGSAGLIFIFGMFLCTAIKNVPLNNKLADFNVDDPSSDPKIAWKEYYVNWIRWNHLRTFSCFLSIIFLFFES